MKTLFCFALLFLSTAVNAAPAARDRVAQTVLAVNLSHGEAISVRRSLTNLYQGDFVNRLEGYARANQPGAYLEVIFDNQVVGRVSLPQVMSTFIIPVNRINGVDYQSFYLRSVGSTYIDSIEAYIASPANPPLEPVPPGSSHPPLEPVPPYPGYPDNNSLRGSCVDADHRQFYAAKNFAYSTAGLNMDSNRATEWGIDYNRTHACNTIAEYQDRFTVLKNLAYSTSGLNMDSASATQYALSKVESIRAEKAREMSVTLNAIKNFAYSTSGLNLSAADAIQIGRQWIERNYCENEIGIQRVSDQYRAEYNYAYASNGLNYDAARAKQYALSRVRGMSACGDLLR